MFCFWVFVLEHPVTADKICTYQGLHVSSSSVSQDSMQLTDLCLDDSCRDSLAVGIVSPLVWFGALEADEAGGLARTRPKADEADGQSNVLRGRSKPRMLCTTMDIVRWCRSQWPIAGNFGITLGAYGPPASTV